MVEPKDIESSYLFRGLQSDQLSSIIGIAVERRFEGGETIFRQFEQSNDILLILSGAVKIKSFQGEDLAELPAGAVVGEIALVDRAPRSATVISSGGTRCCMVPALGLAQLLESDVFMKATIMENLCKVLCSRLRTANIQLDAALKGLNIE